MKMFYALPELTLMHVAYEIRSQLPLVLLFLWVPWGLFLHEGPEEKDKQKDGRVSTVSFIHFLGSTFFNIHLYVYVYAVIKRILQ